MAPDGMEIQVASLEQLDAEEERNPGWLQAVGERHQRFHAEHVARLNAKVHQRRMFAGAALTKHPQVPKAVEPTRRARERKAAPSRRTSSSSSTSSQDPGDTSDPAGLPPGLAEGAGR
jgi:hypothetical protein